MIKRSGQSVMEYCVMATIVLAALLTMQIYMKRGLSGRWQTAFDDIGDQYDPRLTNGVIRHTIIGNANTTLLITYGNLGPMNGYYSIRTDQTAVAENKTGSVQVGN